jgi:hypothetical protein
MRQRFLKEFDTLWFDCLNGDSRETGKLTPEGDSDPSVFSTEYNREGIRVGTAIGTMIRVEAHADGHKRRSDKNLKDEGASAANEPGPWTHAFQAKVFSRQFWGINKRAELLRSLNVNGFAQQYEKVESNQENRYSFRPSEIAVHYYEWPSLTELSANPPAYGHMETRGLSLISHDRQKLENRLRDFFDESVSDENMAMICPAIMAKYARYDGVFDRKVIQKKMTFSPEFIRCFNFKPFDVRFSYLDSQRPLWSEPSTALSAQSWKGNAFLISRRGGVKSPEGSPFLFSANEFERDVISGHARAFPIRVRIWPKEKSKKKTDGNGEFGSILHEAAPAYQSGKTIANLSPVARAYLAKLGIKNCDKDADTAALTWMHALAIGYSPVYLAENADGIRQDWPRIPLPDSKSALLTSAELGDQIAALLNTADPVLGVTAGAIRPELVKIGVVTRLTNQKLNLSLTAGWGHAGQGGVTMPGKGKLETRGYAADETPLPLLGQSTHDIFLNESTCWRNVPEKVWDFTIGGYQVIKKWLSYREFRMLGRALTPDEAREVTHMARRIAALVLLQPELDKNYQVVKAATVPL